MNNTTSSNTVYPERDSAIPQRSSLGRSPGQNQTYFYKNEIHNTINRSIDNGYPPIVPEPSASEKFVYTRELNESNSRNRNIDHPPGGVSVYPSNVRPVSPGPKQTYMYKKETSNTTNTVYSPPSFDNPSRDQVAPVISTPYVNPQNEPSTKYYKYTSETATRNIREQEPLVTRAPFPEYQETQVDGGPPKHLGQLLASFDDVNIS